MLRAMAGRLRSAWHASCGGTAMRGDKAHWEGSVHATMSMLDFGSVSKVSYLRANKEPMGKRPRVFISYSHDSDKHVNEVLSLAERLRDDGIDAVVDQYLNGSPPEGWPRWMLNQLDSADYVLVVCTEVYYRRFRGIEKSGIGKGADWEANLITQEIYNNRSYTNKFVPVFIGQKIENWIPEPLRSKTIYEITSQASYDELYDFLLGQAGIEPGALGPLRPRARTQVGRMTFADSHQKISSSDSPPEEANVSKPSFREILIGRWHIVIRAPFTTGPIGQMNLDLFANGLFRGQLINPFGVSGVEGQWLLDPAPSVTWPGAVRNDHVRVLSLQGMKSSGYQISPYAVQMLLGYTDDSQHLTGTTYVGEQVEWQRVNPPNMPLPLQPF